MCCRQGARTSVGIIGGIITFSVLFNLTRFLEYTTGPLFPVGEKIKSKKKKKKIEERETFHSLKCQSTHVG